MVPHDDSAPHGRISDDVSRPRLTRKRRSVCFSDIFMSPLIPRDACRFTQHHVIAYARPRYPILKPRRVAAEAAFLVLLAMLFASCTRETPQWASATAEAKALPAVADVLPAAA